MPHTTARITEQTETWYKASFKNLSNGVRYIVEAFPTLYKRSLREIEGQFTAEELCLIIDVFNASSLNPNLAGQQVIPRVDDGISLDGLDRKWEVDGGELIAKLRDLHYLQAMSLEIWAANFWYGKEKDLSEYVNQLR